MKPVLVFIPTLLRRKQKCKEVKIQTTRALNRKSPTSCCFNIEEQQVGPSAREVEHSLGGILILPLTNSLTKPTGQRREGRIRLKILSLGLESVALDCDPGSGYYSCVTLGNLFNNS